MATGVPGLDLLLGGGLKRGHTMLVAGEAGTGKTVLCSQIAAAQARGGASVVFATVTSESHNKLIASLETFSFFDRSLVGERLFLLSAYASLKSGPKEARDVLLATVRERKAELIVVDGFRSVRDLWANETLVRDFLYELSVGLDVAGCACLMTAEYALPKLMELSEATTVDGIVSLSTEERRNDVIRRAQVVKLRGQGHAMGRHVMRIGGDGVHIYPRFESMVLSRPIVQPLDSRVSFGVPEIDKLCQGGLPRASTTVIAGSAGIGKTLLGLFFAAAGQKELEPAYVLSLSEQPSALVARAKRLGLDLAPMLEKKLLRIEHHSPGAIEADELVEHICETIAATKAQRFVVDGIDDFHGTLTEQQRLPHLLTAVAARLRGDGVTTLFTKKVSKVVGADLDFASTPISTIAENLLLMRFVELGGELRRVLAFLHVRDSRYDQTFCEFTLDEGFQVLAPLRSAEGILTGAAKQVGHGAHAGHT